MWVALDGFIGGFKIGGHTVTNLRYADDILLITSSVDELQELVSRVHNAATGFEMRVNVSKTVVMRVCDDATPMRVFVGVDMLKEVHSFKYLGALFWSDAVCVQEIKARLAVARERMGSLWRLWWSQTLSNRLKARMIQTRVWLIVTYGADGWTLNLDLTRNIEALKCSVTGKY